jgi:hypothetical protein
MRKFSIVLAIVGLVLFVVPNFFCSFPFLKTFVCGGVKFQPVPVIDLFERTHISKFEELD